MKTTKQIILVLTSLTAAFVMAGCASSSGYKQADKTGKGIADFRDEVVKLKQAVDGAMSNLTDTAATAATDPRKAFQAFATSVDQVESARAKVGKRAADMKAAGDAYFKQWQAQLANINNPEIRNLAQKREAKLNAIFSKLRPLVEQAKTDFDPFLADLRDLRTYLNQDLTIAGVDAAKGIIQKTRDHGVMLQKSLDGLIDEMNSVAAQLTPAKLAEK